MAQQASTPIKFVSPDGAEIPLQGHVLVREQYFALLVNVVAGARAVGTAYKAYHASLEGKDQKQKQIFSDALMGTLQSLEQPIQALDDIEVHLSALGEGTVPKE